MFRAEPNPDRSLLRFEETVLSSFSFLTAPAYAFRCTRTEVTLVRYESQRVFVNVYHGRSSYELGCEIGLRVGGSTKGDDSVEEGFTIWEIARVEGGSVDERVFLQASTPERVEQLVPELAAVVQRYGARALHGDAACFTSLQESRTQSFEQYMTDSRLTQARKGVADAWRKGDFAEVIRLFEPLSENLTPAESKKLEMAKKRLGSH